jgi:hypothetical protein
MKRLKTITGIAWLFGFTSCQSEVDDVQGENPNAANSTTAKNLKRTRCTMVHLMILLMELVLPLYSPSLK